jgi:hypothetical protein
VTPAGAQQIDLRPRMNRAMNWINGRAIGRFLGLVPKGRNVMVNDDRRAPSQSDTPERGGPATAPPR